MTLQAGTRLGPYEIPSPLSAGGMWEVSIVGSSARSEATLIVASSEFERKKRLDRVNFGR